MNSLPQDWKGRKVTILGLARSGLALARALSQRGARVLISDQRTGPELQEAQLQAQKLAVQVETGGHSPQALDCDVLLVSPGVSLYAPLVQEALSKGVLVTGEVEIAHRFCPRPILAVTGTNGKSTTCSLLQACLGPKGRLAGNIGIPLVAEVTGDLEGVDYVVAEISSFQLETVHSFRPRVALLTNITPDHLDRHRTMEEYIRSKARLFAYQGEGDVAIFNQDDEAALRVAAWVTGHQLPLWPHFPPPTRQPGLVLSYSVHQEVSQGAWFRNGWIWGRLPGGQAERWIQWSFDNLPGPHNLSNALAAVLMARQVGTTLEAIEAALAGYRRMHHRLEVVASRSGLRFVDDSKATNVSSVESALSTYDEPIVLIAGGRDKGLDLRQLGQSIARRCHALVGIGEAGPEIVEWARQHGLRETRLASSLDEAVEMACSLAPRPGVVLLSPACTSFDMFRNAEHRGDEFAASVQRWLSHGGVEDK